MLFEERLLSVFSVLWKEIIILKIMTTFVHKHEDIMVVSYFQFRSLVQVIVIEKTYKDDFIYFLKRI